MRLWTTVAAAAAGTLAAGALLAATSGGGGAVVPQAQAQAGFTVSAGQLQINQRISQAAVRRSNRSLNYLAPIRTAQTDAADDGRQGVRPLGQIAGSGQGWTTGQIRDGAITEPKVGDGAVTGSKIGDGAVTTSKVADESITRAKLSTEVQGGLPRWITKVDNGANTTARASSPDFEIARVAAGNYRADFKTDISACTWSATLSTDAGIPNARTIITALDVTNNNRVFLQTRAADGATLVESGFSVQVVC